MTIRLTEEQKIKILNSEDLFSIMQQVFLREKKIDRDKEHLWVVCLASNNKILMIELVALGTVNKTLAEPMDIFSFALQKRAVKIILVHNHPSGDLVHSKQDYMLTEQMAAIGKFINIPLVDHIIISETGYYSFADKGLMARIREENRYDLNFARVDLLLFRMQEMEARQKREMTKTKKEIARNALAEGLTLEQVVKISGLTLKQVEGLRKRK